MNVDSGVRKELERLCRKRGTRKSTFSQTIPTHWSPHQVRHPKTGEALSDDGAWEFVADLLRDGHDIEVIVLEQPPGKKGYVLICEGFAGENIYMKLQLTSGLVIGRSFHISVQKERLQ